MRIVNLRGSVPLFIGLCLVTLGAVPAEDGEKRVKMKDLPAAVQQTVKEQSQGATIRGITQETENGKTLYELELKVNGHGKDVTIDADGTVVGIEEEVTMDSLPPAVRSAIEQNAGKGKIAKVESITKGGTLVAYEAHVKAGGKTPEIKVAPDGTLIKE